MNDNLIAQSFLDYCQQNPRANKIKTAAEKFEAEVVDMLTPDQKGENYHNIHFRDGSFILDVTKSTIHGKVQHVAQ